jgi:hypothetical protein
MERVKKSKARQFPTEVLRVMAERRSTVPVTNVSPKQRENSHQAHLEWVKQYTMLGVEFVTPHCTQAEIKSSNSNANETTTLQ